jgi:hypothetical protein
MKRITAILVVMMALFATEAFAAMHAKGAFGFHRSNAPIGIRWWTSDKMAIDVGVGVSATEVADLEGDDPDATTNLMDFTLDAGLPFLWKSWDKVHVIFRPGVNFTSEQQFISADGGFEKDRASTIAIVAEIEGELFVAENFSVSASNGFAVSIMSPPGDGDSSMDWGTFGNNLTELGVHWYIFGGE